MENKDFEELEDYLEELIAAFKDKLGAYDYDEIAIQYSEVKKTRGSINNRIPKRYTKETLLSAARKLGLNQSGMLIIENESEMDILQDQAMYGEFRDGRNMIDEFLDSPDQELTETEIEYLSACQKAFYSVIIVGPSESGVGVHVMDFLSQAPFFLADTSLSLSSSEGAVLAGRVIPYKDFFISTGAMLPVLEGSVPLMQAPIANMIGAESREEEAKHIAKCVRILIEKGSTDHIGFVDEEEDLEDVYEAAAERQRQGYSSSRPYRRGEKIQRNDPCPCGSGKKYKKCCLPENTP